MGANMAYFQYEITGCFKLCVCILDKIFVHKVTKCRASIYADCYLGLVCIGLQGSRFLWVLDL